MDFHLTLAIDFDGTICSNKSPDIGEPIMPAIETLKRLRHDLKCRLVLWTCREGLFLEKAVQFCHENGLFFDAVNTNVHASEFFGHPKILADFYIDDRTPGWFRMGNQERWHMIEEEIRERAKFNFKNMIKEITP